MNYTTKTARKIAVPILKLGINNRLRIPGKKQRIFIKKKGYSEKSILRINKKYVVSG